MMRRDESAEGDEVRLWGGGGGGGRQGCKSWEREETLAWIFPPHDEGITNVVRVNDCLCLRTRAHENAGTRI